MNTSLSRGSAKIYQFPAGGRAAFGQCRLEDTRPAADLNTSLLGPSPVNEVACGDSWYHEAAIQDSLRER